MSEIEETILRVAETQQEEFILCVDEKHLNSTRVVAFYTRRKMPQQIRDEVGIQRVLENGKHFLRFFPRGLGELPHYVRNKETGNLELKVFIPKHSSQEKQRIAELMRKDGKSEDEIERFLKGE